MKLIILNFIKIFLFLLLTRLEVDTIIETSGFEWSMLWKIGISNGINNRDYSISDCKYIIREEFDGFCRAPIM